MQGSLAAARAAAGGAGARSQRHEPPRARRWPFWPAGPDRGRSGGCDRRRLRVAASPAATARCGPWSSSTRRPAPATGRSAPARSPRALAVRRIPERFVPPAPSASPAEALGLAPRAALPAGSYLLAAQLRSAAARHGGAAAAWAAAAARSRSRSAAPTRCSRPGRRRSGTTVDVVVTGEPSGPGPRPHLRRRRRRCRCWRLQPGPRRLRSRGGGGGDAGADQAAGAAADRRRELRPQASLCCPGTEGWRREQRHLEALAGPRCARS